MKNIAILGSTGSIGVSALDVIKNEPERYRAVALGAGSNVDLLVKQVAQFRPLAVCLQDQTAAEDLKGRLSRDAAPDIFSGTHGQAHLVSLTEVDTVISAISGTAGLLPTYAAIQAGKTIALANKEAMVMAGGLIMAEARRRSVRLLPIDSEHSAILQSLQGHPREDVKRIILTASGGPFRGLREEEIKDVTPEQALRHPNWHMGAKISIDSATLMNKGLEAIEARWLFDLSMDQISIMIHPQSIIHSMVEYKDGSIIAQLGIPDMRIPISYALSFPRHLENKLPSLGLEQIGTLSFERPDTKTFRCVDLAMKAAEIGGSMPAVLNTANEVAVDAFLKHRIGFFAISELIERTMEAHQPHSVEDIESVMDVDRWARGTARQLLQGLRMG